MSNAIQRSHQYNYINHYKKKQEPITIESLSEDLQEYNTKNNDDVMFIDMLEKISLNLTIEEKLSISNNGNKLLEKLDNEISKLNGNNIYIDNISSDVDKFKDLNSEISRLKSQLSKETDKQKILDLQTKILELETLLLTNLS